MRYGHEMYCREKYVYECSKQFVERSFSDESETTVHIPRVRHCGEPDPDHTVLDTGLCGSERRYGTGASSLIGAGLAHENVDLSEKHLAYFNASYLDDPDSPQNGEGVHLVEDTSTKGKYNIGGHEGYASFVFASGIGPAQESNFPYRGSEGEVEQRHVATDFDENNHPISYGYRDVWYSEDDNWDIPESERFEQSYRLENSYILPTPAGVDENGKYSYNQAGTDAIKLQMYQHHRAVTIAYRSESSISKPAAKTMSPLQ